MNIRRICSLFLALAVLSGVLPGAMAETPESPAVSADGVIYMQEGVLYISPDGGIVYYCDYASGQRRPLCTRQDCDHRAAAGLNLGSFSYPSAAEFMNDASDLCYAARLAFTCMPYALSPNTCVMYENKVYFYAGFYPEPQPGTNTLPLYVSEVDGETRLLSDPGLLFSGAYDPVVLDVAAYDGYLYYLVFLFEKQLMEGVESIAPDPDLPAGSWQLMKVSMTTGDASILETFRGENCEVNLIGLYDGILYCYFKTMNGLSSIGTEEEYRKELLSKTRYSVLGIDTATGRTVVPDRRLCGRTRENGEPFDIVKDGILYSIILPETAEDNTALFLGYDLKQRETVLEYPFEYTQTDYYPYRVLTDEIMLTLNFETGTFALRNLKTGEIRLLDIPGACINGNAGQTDWYDLFTAYFQTDPLVLDHCYADGTKTKAYITAGELLGDNPQMHEFADK